MSVVTTLLVGVVVTVLVFGSVSAFLLWLSSVFVVPSKQLPSLPVVLSLIVAWIVSLPVAVFLIESTSLSTLPWGHAGELFILPYVLLTPALFATALAVVRRRRAGGRPAPDQNAEGAE
jgi:hypothetical protein